MGSSARGIEWGASTCILYILYHQSTQLQSSVLVATSPTQCSVGDLVLKNWIRTLLGCSFLIFKTQTFLSYLNMKWHLKLKMKNNFVFEKILYNEKSKFTGVYWIRILISAFYRIRIWVSSKGPDPTGTGSADCPSVRGVIKFDLVGPKMTAALDANLTMLFKWRVRNIKIIIFWKISRRNC